MANQVKYPDLLLGGAPVVVERLRQEQAIRLAPAMLRLIVASYSTQFEGPTKALPHGAFASAYGTEVARKRFQRTVIPRVFERDGGYYAIREPGDEESLVSTLKVLPGEHVEERFAGMVGVAEILTMPDLQNHGYAAAQLNTYLDHDAPAGARAMLDSFQGSSINPWYERLGFQLEEPSGALEVAGHSLYTQYMVTPEELTVSGIVERLQERRPALRSGVVLS